jgi:hypothetical protein
VCLYVHLSLLDSINTFPRQRIHTQIDELLDAVFSVRSLSCQYDVKGKYAICLHGEAIYRKCKRLKLGGGQANDRSSDLVAFTA